MFDSWDTLQCRTRSCPATPTSPARCCRRRRCRSPERCWDSSSMRRPRRRSDSRWCRAGRRWGRSGRSPTDRWRRSRRCRRCCRCTARSWLLTLRIKCRLHRSRRKCCWQSASFPECSQCRWRLCLRRRDRRRCRRGTAPLTRSSPARSRGRRWCFQLRCSQCSRRICLRTARTFQPNSGIFRLQWRRRIRRLKARSSADT